MPIFWDILSILSPYAAVADAASYRLLTITPVPAAVATTAVAITLAPFFTPLLKLLVNLLPDCLPAFSPASSPAEVS